MDYFLSEEQQMIVDTAKQITDQRIIPNRAELDEKHEFPRQILNEMARADLFGVPIPEEYGGFGGGCFDIAAINFVIPHQANMRILKNLIERLNIPQRKVFINVSKYGNTSAASIPIALDEANRDKLMAEGDTVLLCSFGGGFTWGATLIKW